MAPDLLALACLFAGCYGALHNQISYSVSPEYFTQFKFHQFRIAPALPPRGGAAIVGWKASWWMGIVIGAVLIPAGLFLKQPKQYFIGMLWVFFLVTLTTLFVGLTALAVTVFVVDAEMAGQITRYGNEIKNDVAFARAGTMHNFSYLGGMLGIITGCLSIYFQCARQNGTTIARKNNELRRFDDFD